MHEEIKNHIEDPAYLEKLYRKNKADFRTAFMAIYAELEQNTPARFWHERLNYESNSISWGTKADLLFVVIASFLAGLVAKIPSAFSISEDYFYPRNIGFIVFPFLMAFFAWKNKVPTKLLAILTTITVICLIYINLLPDNIESDTLILACIHLPVLLWIILGVAFSGKELGDFHKRLDFLRFNGDAVVMIAILGIASGILSGITFGLFELIGINIEQFFQDYVVVFGLPAIPILAAFLTQTNPQLVNKVSPIIAKLFSPAVLVMLVVYLVAIVYSGKDPYNDREFLLLFNLLLIGVMALIFFSVAESTGKKKYSTDFWILFILSIVTIIVNGIALSAILFRISEWGITPNRMAVLGSNILMLFHLVMIAWKLFGSLTQKSNSAEVGRAIVVYVPIYIIWITLVVFVFPLVFGFQ
ncbi:hypothetical protein SYJ56_07325 [Algoriphagus sp. D3-2-R+10]|uniref:hypothetical protein n=1 Tax=Algoriphagus aurantiacus TaxID=3103948 RepID=UPI002B372B55|nr:hypothetical protein [Algoriphagus sp. D3-2-R+10]MEB2775112.1 hypothetical protein [Algoriphagus sp. D3-2-R+10]